MHANALPAHNPPALLFSRSEFGLEMWDLLTKHKKVETDFETNLLREFHFCQSFETVVPSEPLLRAASAGEPSNAIKL